MSVLYIFAGLGILSENITPNAREACDGAFGLHSNALPEKSSVSELDKDDSFSLLQGNLLLNHQRQSRLSSGSAAYALMTDGKERGDDLTMCTLVDGRGVGISSDLQVSVKHLVLTSHADHAVVLVDCGDGDMPTNLRDNLKNLGISFDYECVNTTDAARSEWAHTWLEDPELGLQQWSGLEAYKSTLRLGLHQCLSKRCKTRFCAWADSDLLMIPTHHEGWARGMRDCLSCSEPDHASVFAQLQWADLDSKDTLSGSACWNPETLDKTAQCKHAEFNEFSSQAFVVDRSRLFDAWLPVSTAQASKWEMGLKDRDGTPLSGSALEGTIVGKSFNDYEQCKGHTEVECLPVSLCKANDGYQTMKLHTSEINYATHAAALSALSANLTQLDAELVRFHQALKTSSSMAMTVAHGQSKNCPSELVELRENIKRQLKNLGASIH